MTTAEIIKQRGTCSECYYWKRDMGIFTATGWTGDGRDGQCRFGRVEIYKSADSTCSNFERK